MLLTKWTLEVDSVLKMSDVVTQATRCCKSSTYEEWKWPKVIASKPEVMQCSSIPKAISWVDGVDLEEVDSYVSQPETALQEVAGWHKFYNIIVVLKKRPARRTMSASSTPLCWRQWYTDVKLEHQQRLRKMCWRWQREWCNGRCLVCLFGTI